MARNWASRGVSWRMTVPTTDARSEVRSYLRTFLDGEHAEIRDRARTWLGRPGNEPVHDLPREEHRERVLAWAKELADEGDTAVGFPEAYGGEGDVGRWIAGFEALAFGDLSLLVKCGVQFGLFGGAVHHLRTERHHERYLRDIATLDLPGCFAMTETGHGSNVQALGTTAGYDREAGEFVVHTPEPDAQKDYIGNAARDGRLAAVFAQLVVGGEQRGVHALLVPLRDEHGNVLPGVEIEVCGAGIGATKVALTIAVRYALERRQFGPPDGEEAVLLDYRVHQRRLLPALATAYALHFAQDRLRRQLHEVFTAADPDDRRRRELETLAAGVKAVATWHATDTIQACREACGGAGYLRVNRFAALKADSDVFTTFEGDNTVLLQLTAKNLLTDYRDQYGELDPFGAATITCWAASRAGSRPASTAGKTPSPCWSTARTTC